MSQWHVQNGWQEKLASIGLGDLESALSFRGGDVMSNKKRSRTCQYVLSGFV